MIQLNQAPVLSRSYEGKHSDHKINAQVISSLNY